MIVNFRQFGTSSLANDGPRLSYAGKSRFLCSVNSKLSELLSTTVAGEPAADDEEGGHPDEKQEALVEKQEEEGRRLPRPRRRHG